MQLASLILDAWVLEMAGGTLVFAAVAMSNRSTPYLTPILHVLFLYLDAIGFLAFKVLAPALSGYPV